MSDGQQDAEQQDLTFEQLMFRVGELFEGLEDISDEKTREQVFELLDLLEAYHREGITRLAMSISPGALEAAHEDPLVSHLLEAYLGEEEGGAGAPDALIEEALTEIRPYVHSHGGEMEVVSIESGIVTLRLMGACDGCPASDATLTQGVESILRERWPGFRGLRVEGDEGTVGNGHSHGPSGGGAPNLLQIQSLRGRRDG